jgi:hypothetical protein
VPWEIVNSKVREDFANILQNFRGLDKEGGSQQEANKKRTKHRRVTPQQQ